MKQTFTSPIDNCEFDYQIREYLKDYKYKITSEYMPPQFITNEV